MLYKINNVYNLYITTISVLAPPNIGEQIKDFWTVYGGTISILIAGFAGAFSTYLFDHLKQRKKVKEET
jgi:hypothetical protein